jgi:hypothetical protein
MTRSPHRAGPAEREPSPRETDIQGDGWVLVPREPAAKQIAAMIMCAVAGDPSEADFGRTGAVLELLPPTGHPDARAVIADMIRDYRAMVTSAPSPPVLAQDSAMAPVQAGCICPPGAEISCRGPLCPRRPPSDWRAT